MALLSAIYHYPVKGFNGLALDSTILEHNSGIPNDRRYAITKGLPHDFDGSWMPSRSFTGNSRTDNLLKYKLMAVDAAGHVRIEAPNGSAIDIGPEESTINKANEAMADFTAPMALPEDLPVPRLIEHNGSVHNTKAMWDYLDTPISIINIETTRAIGASLGNEIDPLRFRGNLMVSGLQPWAEFGWIGKQIRIGDAVLEVIRPIDRCPATSVNPSTGERDMDMPLHLQQTYGHVFCGVYARVVTGGAISREDKIIAENPSTRTVADILNENAPAYALWPRLARITERTSMGDTVLLAVTLDNPWPLPCAEPGQRARIHLPQGGTGARIEHTAPNRWMLEIAPSLTGDPLTEQLRTAVKQGEEIVVSGPYGRPS